MRTTLQNVRLVDAALQEAASSRLAYDPWDEAAIGRSQRDFAGDGGYDRSALATLLSDYTARIGGDAAAVANCRRLADRAATVVVTGQQAGLFGGPLYAVHKAVTALNLARTLSERSGLPVTPLFWLATEDNDLSEIAPLTIPPHRFRAAFPEPGVAAEALPVAPVRAVVAEVLETFADSRTLAGLRSLLEVSGSDYGEAAAGFLSRLFAGTGLVVLEPRLLRDTSVEFFCECVRRRDAIREALARGAEWMQGVALTPAFAPEPDGCGLFHIDADGRRYGIRYRDGTFRAGDRVWSEREILEAIASAPGQFSTGAYLRPIQQTLRLPNAVFVAGPSEFVYHLQLCELYALFGARMPALRLRNHATLLGPREQRLVAKLGLAPGDLLQGAAAFHRTLDLPEDMVEPFRSAEAGVGAALAGLRSGTGELVNPRTLDGLEALFRKELGRLRDKCRKEFSRRAGVDNRRVDQLFSVVRPGGLPQERRVNVLAFLDVAGDALIPGLIEHMDPLEGRHYLFDL